ncbi:MAG: hypothetical protein KCHDKBKB_02536 [Elusimicrobia bacterium]|nr:hypothetical protein [Elusimicrobiota bacterium]
MTRFAAGPIFILSTLLMGGAVPCADAKKQEEYRAVTFDFLGGFQTMSQYTGRYRHGSMAENEPNATRVPENVMALNGKKISIQGFMVPLEVPDARVKTFLLVRDKASCCFGGPPKLTHRIYVTMDGDKSAEFFPDNIVTVKGTLNIVGSVIEEDTMALYEMKADEVSVLQK